MPAEHTEKINWGTLCNLNINLDGTSQFSIILYNFGLRGQNAIIIRKKK